MATLPSDVLGVPRPDWMEDDVAMLADMASRWLEAEVVPHYDRYEKQEMVDRSAWEGAGAAGLLCAAVPEEYGGSGGTYAHEAAIIEALGRTGTDGFGIALHNAIVAPYILHFGSEEQKKTWLPKMASGEMIGAIAMTEPGAGSDLQGIKTSAKKNGNHYVINGSKTFITNGPIAGAVGVVAKQDNGKFAVYMVEAGDEGYAVERTLEKLGCRSSQVGELVFDDVRLDESRRISPAEGSEIEEILDVLIRGRILISAASLGVATAAFDLGLAYAKERTAFGRKIGGFQEISMKFAEADARIAAARLLTYRAAVLCDSRSEVPVREVAHAKLMASETALWVVDQMMRVFGGMGFMREAPIERLYRDVRYFQIVEGTTEIQHRILAKALGL